MPKPSAEDYDRRFPDVDIPQAQKEERMDRRAFKEERATGRRTTRNRGIVIPELPWKRGKEQT